MFDEIEQTESNNKYDSVSDKIINLSADRLIILLATKITCIGNEVTFSFCLISMAACRKPLFPSFKPKNMKKTYVKPDIQVFEIERQCGVMEVKPCKGDIT